MKNPVFTVRELCAAALGAALMVVCTWIAVPLPSGISFTLQTFAVFLITGLLGLKLGTTSVIVYLLLGAVGLPVFTGFQGGFAGLLGVTGGYLIGFIFTAVIVGVVTHFWGKKVPVLIIAMVLGLAVCYLFGSIWFEVLYTRNNGSGMAFASILGLCVVPYLLPDAAKMAVAILIIRRLDGHLPAVR